MSLSTGPYEKLKERFLTLNALGESAAVLHWDMAVMMPSGGAAARSEQLATLKALRHELLVAPDVAEWLDAAEKKTTDDPWDTANIRKMRHAHTHAVTVPVDLVKALSRACSSCEMVWRDARSDNDFARVAPLLANVLKLTTETAACKADALKTSPYDALLNQYEPDISTTAIDSIFAELEAFLPTFLDTVIEKQKAHIPLPLSGPFPVPQQKSLALEIMQRLGFDFDHGRLDGKRPPLLRRCSR